MEKREKIIIISTLVVALYGAVDFLVLSKKKGSDLKSTPQDSSEMVTTIATQLSAQNKGDTGEIQDLVSKIYKSWPSKAFANISADKLLAKKEESDAKENIANNFTPGMFNYSGFVEMGDARIAIINGTDYKIDDIIEGYTLKQITPDSITVTWEGLPFEVAIEPTDLAGDIQPKAKSSKNKNSQH